MTLHDIQLMVVGCATLLCVGCDSRQPDQAATAASGLFVEVTGEVGLDFRHYAALEERLLPNITGAGGAVFDYDNDGRLDIYLVNGGGDRDEKAQWSNRLYRQSADGRFLDVTDAAGVGDSGFGMGCAVGDIDNDGDMDLFVTNFGPDKLYVNNGDGTFTDGSEAAGMSADRWSTAATFFDYDRDGLLDLYVGTYLSFTPPRECTGRAGTPEYCGPGAFAGVPDHIYRNEGSGKFTDKSRESGVARIATKALGVVSSDFNDDGWMDLMVANDGEANTLWMNQGDGSFEDQALMRGIAVNVAGEPEAGMGVALGDTDADGDLDLIVTHLKRETNTLYENLGGGVFEDRTAMAGLGPESLPSTGFGVSLGDYDNDGDLDLAIANGGVSADLESGESAESEEETSPGMMSFIRQYAQPNMIFQNDGAGLFTHLDESAGSFVTLNEVSRGLLAMDIDRDGGLDLLLTSSNAPARLFRNNVSARGHWITLRLIDPALKRDALGAKLELEAGGMIQVREVTSSRSYLMSADGTVHFGLGDADRIDRLTVTWPDGTVEHYADLPTDQFTEIRKGSGVIAP